MKHGAGIPTRELKCERSKAAVHLRAKTQIESLVREIDDFLTGSKPHICSSRIARRVGE